MVDNFKTMIPDYNPKDGSSLWNEKENEELPPYKTEYTRRFYNKNLKKRKYPLKLLLTANEKTEKMSLSISGSIKKWYFQENSRRDLNADEFVDCMKLLAEELSIDYETLLNGKVTKLEVGLTVTLKPDMRNITDCFVKYRNAKRIIREETSLYFEFENYKLVFYDKFLEMQKNKIWTENHKKVFDRFHFLRFEIRVKKVSGTNFKGNFDTIEKLINNWDKLPLIIENNIKAINFVDLISKEENMEINNYSDFVNHFTFLGIKDYGIQESINLFDKEIESSNKTKMLNKFLDIYRSNITNESDPKAKLLLEVRKKLSRLYNKSNIKYNSNNDITH